MRMKSLASIYTLLSLYREDLGWGKRFAEESEDTGG